MTRSKLSYAIIKDSKRGSYKIYICPSGSKTISLESLYEKEFLKLKVEMQKYGFSHLSFTTFRSKENTTIKGISGFFKKFNIKRNKDVEKSMLEHIETASNESSYHFDEYSNQTLTETPKFSANYVANNILGLDIKYVSNSDQEDVHSNSKLAIKHSDEEEVKKLSDLFKVGDTIRLSLYMFLTIQQSLDGSIKFDLEFDFKSPVGDEKRRFVHHSEIEFINKGFDLNRRINLQSAKTYKEILKDVHYLYSISIMNMDGIISGKSPEMNIYNAIELRHYIDLERLLHMSFSSNEFIKVLAISSRIRKEKEEYDRNTIIPMVFIRDVSKAIADRLHNRMLDLSTAEEYEAAIEYKKSKEFVEKKIEMIDELQDNGLDKITCDIMDEKFSMKEFDF